MALAPNEWAISHRRFPFLHGCGLQCVVEELVAHRVLLRHGHRHRLRRRVVGEEEGCR